MTLISRLLPSWGRTRPSPAFLSIRSAPSGAMPAYLWPLEVLLRLYVSDKICLAPQTKTAQEDNFPLLLVGITQSCLIIAFELVWLSLCLRSITKRLWRRFVCEKILGRIFEINPMGEPGVGKAGLGEKEELNCDTGLFKKFYFLIKKCTYYKTYYLTIFIYYSLVGISASHCCAASPSAISGIFHLPKLRLWPW